MRGNPTRGRSCVCKSHHLLCVIDPAEEPGVMLALVGGICKPAFISSPVWPWQLLDHPGNTSLHSELRTAWLNLLLHTGGRVVLVVGALGLVVVELYRPLAACCRRRLHSLALPLPLARFGSGHSLRGSVRQLLSLSFSHTPQRLGAAPSPSVPTTSFPAA